MSAVEMVITDLKIRGRDFFFIPRILKNTHPLKLHFTSFTRKNNAVILIGRG